jgi:nucleoid DNA-binding protein
MIEEFTYQLQVTHLSRKNKISVNKSRNFIKEYRRLLKKRLKEGEKIEILGIAEIWPSVRESVNEMFDTVYDYERQVKDVAESLEMDTFEVHHLLKSYIRMLVTKLKMGYSVKISGVLLVKPDLFDDDTYGYLTRLSPTLEKPEELVLKVRRLYGHIDELNLTDSNMIFRLELSESLGVPSRLRLVGEYRSQVQFVDDSLLG